MIKLQLYILLAIISVGLTSANITNGSAWAQNNALSQSGNSDAVQGIGQTISSAQLSECL